MKAIKKLIVIHCNQGSEKNKLITIARHSHDGLLDARGGMWILYRYSFSHYSNHINIKRVLIALGSRSRGLPKLMQLTKRIIKIMKIFRAWRVWWDHCKFEYEKVLNLSLTVCMHLSFATRSRSPCAAL